MTLVLKINHAVQLNGLRAACRKDHQRQEIELSILKPEFNSHLNRFYFWPTQQQAQLGTGWIGPGHPLDKINLQPQVPRQ